MYRNRCRMPKVGALPRHTKLKKAWSCSSFHVCYLDLIGFVSINSNGACLEAKQRRQRQRPDLEWVVLRE